MHNQVGISKDGSWEQRGSRAQRTCTGAQACEETVMRLGAGELAQSDTRLHGVARGSLRRDSALCIEVSPISGTAAKTVAESRHRGNSCETPWSLHS